MSLAVRPMIFIKSEESPLCPNISATPTISKGADVVNFVRFEVGEGIEKKTEDFAAEVAAQMEAAKK